ncbi:MAG: hypothetical protein WCI51_06325 [Lentisphaerota bacterium]
MYEERIPKKELEQFLESLKGSLANHAALYENLIKLSGLPVEEWAGPGYAIGALFDPYVLTAELKPSTIYLEWPDAALPGISRMETRTSQKEKISFRINAQRSPEFSLPMLWDGVEYQSFTASDEWRIMATIAELPALAVQDGSAVFAFNPLKVIHRYLNMADPATTRDLTGLLIKAVLGASGIDRELDDDDLRRDFHALGVNSLLLGQMHLAAGQSWNVNDFAAELRTAATAYVDGNRDQAREILSRLFRMFAAKRQQLVQVPVYIMVMPHGGILFEHEGYAEYDSPEMAARVLNLFLDWADTSGFHFSPDIGAGTLEEFAKMHPKTVRRLRYSWEQGRIEMVNGTYSQPYLQLWPQWDQEKQFEFGLKTFERLFGRRPEVYAAQEIAHHPALPEILQKYGFKYAIHRAQNLGLMPVDHAPVINWQSPSGASIRALPSHPLRSERRGGEIWRHFPIIQTSSRNRNLPFIAFTSLMDQTFIDIYNEEIVRANRYAPVWGEFVTPSEFFARTADIKAVDTCYKLDQYDYALDLAGNSIHGHQTGGYSSEHAFMFNESARLQALPEADEKELKKLLTQEAHDCYIIPYFAPGYFMEGGLTDYTGPRYRCVNDAPRGLARVIRDAAGYPQHCSDFAPASPESCSCNGTTLSWGGHTVRFDKQNGSVIELDGIPVSLGNLKFDGAVFQAETVTAASNRLIIAGTLPWFGGVILEYFASGNRLYGEVSVADPKFPWTDTKICWGSCVYLEHAKPHICKVVRTVSGVSEPTAKERFHSLGTLELNGEEQQLRLHHGGNIFFRQTEKTVCNRLWCYDEFCDRFWWAIELDWYRNNE